MLFSKKPLLVVELVPKSCWGQNLRMLLLAYRPEFKSTITWDVLRRQVYAQAGNKCEICSGRGPKWPVECHEVWDYKERNDVCVQRLVRMIALCPSCHQVKHLGFAAKNGLQNEALAHLAAVNGWSATQVSEHVIEMNELFVARSKKKWRLDLGGLLDYGVPERDLMALSTLSGDPSFSLKNQI